MRFVAALFLCWLPVSLPGQPLQFDPAAKALAEKSAAAYKALTSYRMKATGTGGSSEFASVPAQVEIRFRRANRFFARISEQDRPGGTTVMRAFAWDGRTIYQRDPATGKVTEAPHAKVEWPPEIPLAAMECEPLLHGRPLLPETAFPGGRATVASPEDYHGTKVDVLRVEASIPESEALFRMDLLIAQFDSLIRGIRFKLSGKHPINSKPISGDFELRYTLVETKPVFGPSDFRIPTSTAPAPTQPKRKR